MDFLKCLALSSLSMVLIFNVVVVMKSFISGEEYGLYAIKLIASVFFNGLFIWLAIGIILGG